MNTIKQQEPRMAALELIEDTPAPSNIATLPLVNATPADLLRIAVQNNADLDRLERLMALQVQWEEREAKKAYVAAMAAFKAEPLTIFKAKQVGYKTKEGDFVGYAHAELSDVTDVVGPAMARNGLSYRWDIKQEPNRINVSCIVTHALGHSESVTMDAAPDNSGKKNAIQQIASSVTYLQRYTLLAATGMSTKGMDDDGESGGDATTRATQAQASNYDDAIAAGRAAAMEGMPSLTAWWGRLTGKQRADLGNEFASMRKAAQQADQGAGR